MNNCITSKEAILKNCRQLVSKQGLQSLNMRTVAKECNVALGSIYYYFPSKNDLLIETIESVWEDIFRLKDLDLDKLNFKEYIEVCFDHILDGIQKYPNFFTIHSISLSTKDKIRAKDIMNKYVLRIKKRMEEVLDKDKDIKTDIFLNELSKEDFIDFVISNIVYLLIQHKKDCDVLLKIIYCILYI
ncbi:MAG: TetR/AcrR family transcriptional regulator [Eubacteriales bacterium]|nr:TetR/AcrR family transcriptional regulator [Eubacteriales bacterium]MDY3332897.1 TetR/AcrR family transcriptional regulator [Gallibacter sp.]